MYIDENSDSSSLIIVKKVFHFLALKSKIVNLDARILYYFTYSTNNFCVYFETFGKIPVPKLSCIFPLNLYRPIPLFYFNVHMKKGAYAKHQNKQRTIENKIPNKTGLTACG